jgi:hypothetical protein
MATLTPFGVPYTQPSVTPSSFADIQPAPYGITGTLPESETDVKLPPALTKEDMAYVNATPSLGPNIPNVPESSNALPTILAVLAAARGNIGPLFQIQEQKRKTEIFKVVGPLLNRFDELVDRGNEKDATKLLNETFARFGSRAPEISQFINPRLQHLQTLRKEREELNTYVKAAEIQVKAQGAKAPQALKDFLAMIKSVDSPSAMRAVEALAPKFMNFEGQLVPGGGGVAVSNPNIMHADVLPLPTVFNREDLPAFTAQTLQQDYGLNPPDVVNVMRDRPVMQNGQNITPVIREGLGRRIAQLAATEQNIDLRKLAPTSNEYNEAAQQVLKAQGSKNPQLDLVTGNYSAGTGQQIRNSIESFLQQRATAPIRAQLDTNLLAFQQAGMSVINRNPHSPSFGRTTLMTPSQVVANKDYMGVRNPVLDEHITPAINAVDGLNYIDDMFAAVGDPNSTMDRLSVGLARTIQEYVGHEIDPNITLAKVAEMIANRAIEVVEETKALNVREVGQLKRYVTGAFANPATAKAAKENLRGRIFERLSTYMDLQEVKKHELPKVPEPKVIKDEKTGTQFNPRSGVTFGKEKP